MKKRVLRVLFTLAMVPLLLIGCSANTNMDTNTDLPTDAGASAGTKSVSNASGLESSETGEKGFGKVLVVYYSLTGNTREVAEIIKDKTGGDIFEIQPEFDYHRSDVEEVAKKHVAEGYQPKLMNSVSNIDEYDFILIGSPVWWFSVSPPVMSFLSQYDLEDKKVVPFCTYGSDYGDFFEQFNEECPNAKVLKGIDFTQSQLEDMEKVNGDIETWLKGILEERV